MKKDIWEVGRLYPPGEVEKDKPYFHGANINTPVDEPPICCPEKPTALQPMDRFREGWKPGDLTCEPKAGGCGLDWRKKASKVDVPIGPDEVTPLKGL